MPTLVWWVGGLMLPHLLIETPGSINGIILILLGILLLIFPIARRAAILVMCMGWTITAIDSRLSSRIINEIPETEVTGTVISVPERHGDSVSFRFRGAETLLVRWYRDAPQVRVGERWVLSLRILPPGGRLNFNGMDIENWYFTQGISGLGRVLPAGGRKLEESSGYGLQQLRAVIRDRINQSLVLVPGAGLVLALAIADRSGLSSATRAALVVTGTGHLLAISGMHVGMVAMMSYWFMRLALVWLPLGVPGMPLHLLAWMGAGVGAACYSALAGFATSTRRAFIMISVVLVCALARRLVNPHRALGVALLLVLVMDPLSPASAGFWLSFTAVAVLIWVFYPRHPGIGKLRTLLMAQGAISLVMLPLGLLWFQQAGAAGLLVNLLAIPWVSLVTLPLVLVALLGLPFDSAFSEIILYMSANSADFIARVIEVLAVYADPISFSSWRPHWLMVLLASLAGFILLLPRLYRQQWLILALYIQLFIPPWRPVQHGGYSIEMLDVGQGLAVLLRTGGMSLLYDTGPGMPGQWDLYHAVLQPALSAPGIRPDWLLLSHGDLDHSGGLATLQDNIPIDHLLANMRHPGPGIASCHDERRWTWDGVNFQVLHPGFYLPYLGNNSSCVISVRGTVGGLLLPGDIETKVERRLVANYPGGFQVVVAPHHGSKTSSSSEFLDWAKPEYVLVSAGANNRFGFPHEEVLRRYRAREISIWSTADCGALRVRVAADGTVTAESARRKRLAFWRIGPSPLCP